MTLYDFLRCKTRAIEICLISENGFVATICWTGRKEMPEIPERLRNKEVVSDKWGKLPIVNGYNETVRIPCHYIDVGD